MKTRDITYIGIMAAVLCLISPFSVTVGVIPVSLATFGVYLSASVLGRKGCIAVLIYILLGLVGLPVFSGFEGGAQKIAGVTGGYIIGYIPCAFIIGLMTERLKTKYAYPLSMFLGTTVCYIIGTVWFVFVSKMSATVAMLSCVVPFLVGDIIKILIASLLGIKVKSFMKSNPHKS